MDRTNGFIGWQSTICVSSVETNDDTSTWGWTNWDDVLIRSTFPDPDYRDGQRLKPGQSRTVPFWVMYCDRILHKESITNYKEPIMKMRLCGTYSRHYDKVRKFRKKRLF